MAADSQRDKLGQLGAEKQTQLCHANRCLLAFQMAKHGILFYLCIYSTFIW